MNDKLIELTKQRIVRGLVTLRRLIKDYELYENERYSLKKDIQRWFVNHRFEKYDTSDLAYLNNISFSISNIYEDNVNRLRKIDNVSGATAAFIALLIDECIEHYTNDLKIWIRDKLEELNDTRDIEVGSFEISLIFPNAATILAPYLTKTRTESRLKYMVSIRNKIYDLVYEV